MSEIECPACGKMIPDDSRYCDMCGVELLQCVGCGTLGSDAFCPECGQPMISRKSSASAATPGQSASCAGDGDKTIGRRKKRLLLRSRKGNISIEPESEAVIGRKDSPYAGVLEELSLISRRHGKFVCRGGDWYIIDFASTNGTYVNDREVPPDTPVKFGPGDVVDIGTYIFDVVEA